MKKLKEDILREGKERNNRLTILSIEEVVINERHRWKIYYKCNTCGYEGCCYWDNFKRQGCPECKKQKVSDKLKIYSDKEIEDKIKEDGFELIERNYSRCSCLVKCMKCGTLNARSVTVIMNKNRKCSICDGQNINTNDFKEIVKEIGNNEYEVLSEYINSKTKINIKHNICGNNYWVTPDNFKRGRRCPYCNNSKGEEIINDILNCHDITFYREFSFNDLYGDIEKLRFDFAIFENEKLYCLIEYDGEFHYKKTTLNNNLEKQVKYDELKNEYCKNNNIKLIRIPYWEKENIKNILLENGVIK